MGVIEAVKAILLAAIGAALGWLFASAYADIVTAPAAREQGAQTERLVHEDQRRRAEAQTEADRRAAQSRIDAIERGFHEREAERLARMSALEAALEQEQDDADPIPPAVDGSAPVCGPAVPRRLRDALDPIGRAAPRDDPAGSPAAVR